MSAGEQPTKAAARAPVLLLKLVGSLLLTVALMALVEWTAGMLVEPMRAKEILGDTVSRTVTYIEVNPAPLVRDADLLWRNEPGARKTQPVNPRAYGRNDQWTIENNSQGFRGPEVDSSSAAKKKFRILCVGDSITFGFSADQPDTYPEQLSALLSGRFPDLEFEVINAGVPGWSYLQGLRFLDLEGMALEPDLIVIGHGTNDQMFPAKMTDEERLIRLASPVRRYLQKLAVVAAETNTYRAISQGRPPPPEGQPSPGCRAQIEQTGGCRRMSVDHIASAVHEVAVLTAREGVDLLVANTDFVQTAAIQGVRRGVEKDHVPFLDLVDTFVRRRQDDENQRARRLNLAPVSTVALKPGSTAPKDVILRVLVPDPSRSYSYDGTGYYHPEYKSSGPLYDDGTHGDERAGDGVFSVTVAFPSNLFAIEYKYYQGETPEFEALPPLASTLGDRVLPAPGNLVGPVDVFGESLFMVERAHPNREGHQLIARLIADKIEELPGFRKYVHGARRVDAPVPASGGQASRS